MIHLHAINKQIDLLIYSISKISYWMNDQIYGHARKIGYVLKNNGHHLS